MAKRITKEELKESLRHYWRMRKYVKKCDPKEKATIEKMYNEITETWYGESCNLCKKYSTNKHSLFRCKRCPLYLNNSGCEFHYSPWRGIIDSYTWEEWIINANYMVKTFMELPRKKKSILSKLRSKYKWI